PAHFELGPGPAPSPFAQPRRVAATGCPAARPPRTAMLPGCPRQSHNTNVRPGAEFLSTLKTPPDLAIRPHEIIARALDHEPSAFWAARSNGDPCRFYEPESRSR